MNQRYYFTCNVLGNIDNKLFYINKSYVKYFLNLEIYIYIYLITFAKL